MQYRPGADVSGHRLNEKGAALVRRITATTLATGLLATLGAASATAAPASHEETYLVVSTNSTTASAMSLESAVEAAGGTNAISYDAIGATVATLSPSEAASLDAKANLVVSKNGTMHATDVGKGPITASDTAPKIAAMEFGANAAARSWGLDRVDQRPSVLDGQFNLPRGLTGAGVNVYVFDTGIAQNHPEFAGRIGKGYDFVGDGYGANDAHGHGTHVAGTIASNIFGVAPGATLHSVRVLDANGSGYLSDLIAAMDAVAAEAPAASVANASLGSTYNAAVNQAVTNFIERTNMPFAVAAGNSADDVLGYSPASTPQATTVAASEAGDHDAFYSNYGEEIDLYAPGTDIWSTDFLDPASMSLLSGTSMAAPHVAGYLALYTQSDPIASWQSADAAVKAQATPDVIQGTVGGTPNRLLYTSALIAGQAPSAPPAGITAVTHTSITMDWAKPARANGTISAYHFGWSGGGRTWTGRYVPGSARDPFVFTNLKANTTYTVWVQAMNQHGSSAKTVLTKRTLQPPFGVSVKAVSSRSKFYINVNPNRPGRQYYTFTVQKRNGSRWVNYRSYATSGSGETRTVNLPKGTWRAVVQAKYGYRTTYSSSVTLKK